MLHSTQKFLSGNATPEASRALPVLDLSLMDGTAVEQQSFIQQLRVAARDVGFFYLTGHGQTQQKQQQILALAKQFFALPLADKQQVQMIHSPHFRGYTGLGGELTRGQPDIREQFDVMREEAVPAQTDISPAWQGLIGPNQWPTALPQMKTELLNWQQSLVRYHSKTNARFNAGAGNNLLMP